MSWRTLVKEKGLAISELRASELLAGLRFDAEVYGPEYLQIDGLLKSKPTISLVELSSHFSKGIFDIKAEVYSETEGVPFVRIANLKNAIIDTSNLVFIPEEENSKNKKTALKRGDVVLSKTAVALASFVDIENCNVSQDTIAFKYKIGSPLSSEALVVFLNSKYGLGQMQRWFTGNIQMHLNLTDAKNIIVPLFPKTIDEKVRALFSQYIELRKKATQKYNEAEQVLLKEINLEGYKGTEEAISVRNFSEALADNRFDAEYWQPDYDVIQNAIKKHKDGYDAFDNLFVITDKKATIEPDTQYLYAELADVNGSMGTIDNFTAIQGKELPSRGRMSLKKDDVVMSSLDGSLSKIALITSEEKNIIGSTGFFVLRKKEYEPEVALVLLKSKPIQTLLKRQGQGTILSAIPRTSLSRVALPKLDQAVQKKIQELVVISHKEKEEAKDLLEKAKRAVEIFVEKDEKEALKYLG